MAEKSLSPTEPLEQAATALVEAAAQLGVVVAPAYFAVADVVLPGGSMLPLVAGPIRHTLEQALADAVSCGLGCGVALSARLIFAGDDGKPGKPEQRTPEPPRPKAERARKSEPQPATT